MFYVIIARYRDSWFDRYFRFSAPIAVAAFIGAMFVNFWAIHQATNNASASVTDIILSNIPVFEVDGIFVYGTLLVVLVSVVMLLMHPKRIPFALHAVTLFIFIRSAFTLMTHLGPPEVAYLSDFGATITNSFFGADQFFSGHTGMPFLGALAFWGVNNKLKWFFLLSSIFFATVVLLGHIHYTIDVVSAFFITYGIYHITLWLFPRERKLFLDDTTTH
ncbi:hypothetical protein A3D70_00265 [Candidatus Adlerbacteria bacterium RIFCSPHIGHO2_02_FULL_54_18]|uniref:Sphingomyelin synthase-like domain-containing protein n=2 Tax=Candidatus Adleribacteriota TaxID=1752736 RepID=A0A1F4Y6S6_9BACT|nr:MAG: hypothetical protein A2949_03030 [Candidatus Adlerbacteria bacterium RIFCSPLOWO2_01_FULL_54_21b]OGC88973.1 MAG: hypothetical protein A3D70_00265 [Candidatus Adlerbacteria bacterium RIFCSPHIGHO2_02_FULL_54_18]